MVTSTSAPSASAQRDLGTTYRLAEADLEPIADIAAAHPHGASTATATEQILNHVLEIGCVLERAGVRHSGRRPGSLGKVAIERLAHLRRAAGIDLAAIVLPALLLVRQQLVGGGDFLEALLRFLVARMQIGVRGLGELAIGGADLVRGRISGNAETS